MQAIERHAQAGETSVGMRVQLDHLQPTAVGSQGRRPRPALEKVEGRRLIFTVTVADACGLVAAGKVTRVMVDRDAVPGEGALHAWPGRGRRRTCGWPPARSLTPWRRWPLAPRTRASDADEHAGPVHVVAARDHRPRSRARPSTVPVVDPAGARRVHGPRRARATGRAASAPRRRPPGPACDSATLFAVLELGPRPAARHRSPGSGLREAVGDDGDRRAGRGAQPRRLHVEGATTWRFVEIGTAGVCIRRQGPRQPLRRPRLPGLGELTHPFSRGSS